MQKVIMPFWKAVLLTICILILSMLYIAITSFLGLKDPWIAFLALLLWGVMGMKMEQAPNIFLGGAVGLLIAMLLGLLMENLGTAGLIIFICLIVLAISFQMKNWLPLLCNFGLFLFLTIGTAPMALEQKPHLKYLENLAFGAVCFWLLPWLILKLRSSFKNEEKKAKELARQ